MPDTKKILREVLKEITPGSGERKATLAIVNTFLSELNRSLKKNSALRKLFLEAVMQKTPG